MGGIAEGQHKGGGVDDGVGRKRMKRWMGKGKGLGGCLSKGLAKRAGDLLGFGLVGLGPAGQGFVGSGRSYDVQRPMGQEGGPHPEEVILEEAGLRRAHADEAEGEEEEGA